MCALLRPHTNVCSGMFRKLNFRHKPIITGAGYRTTRKERHQNFYGVSGVLFFCSKIRKGEKRMKFEKQWEGEGRDSFSLQELLDWNEAGFEFVIENGHITSLIIER